ncbi:uncharacterized protein LOC112460419 [Temnothorax curvispinosus]|uniref:Uncharacterized protein LOC112460419 n=1 Tax=Temnothorax curvispinosus TaxID=300111 RepID=A0A6J1QET3_9HYME|nr:uncharacterized protein LOC112460419 [Temnothorax curvispinosus]
MLRSQGNKLCAAPFDGPHKDVAHAFFSTEEPNYIWEVHVDKSETWHIQLNKNPPGSLEDVLSIQHLYGAKENAKFPKLATTTTATTKDVETDLCTLRNVDTVLIMNGRLYISHKRYMWSIDIDGKTYKKPLLLTDYMKFLPKNFTRLTAAYQAPSGNIVLFAGNMSYMITYPRVKLVSTWPRSHTDLGLLDTNAKINAMLNTNEGRSYIIYNDNVVGEIDDCSMTIVKFYHIDIIFPGIPHSVSSAFRYIDGNLYFISKNRFYRFNEFTKTVTAFGNLIWRSSRQSDDDFENSVGSVKRRRTVDEQSTELETPFPNRGNVDSRKNTCHDDGILKSDVERHPV